MRERGNNLKKVRMGAAHTVVLLAFVVLFSAGCNIQQHVILGVQEGSSITVTPTSFFPPFTTNMTGSIDNTLNLHIDLFDVLFWRPLNGTVHVNSVLIAGTSAFIGSSLPTGTICSALDPSLPQTDGTININLLKSKLTLVGTTNTLVQPTSPVIRGFLGSAADIQLPVLISATAPVNIFDLLGAIAGQVFPLSFSQPIDFTLPPTNPLLPNGHVTGTLFLESVATAPTGTLLDDCVAFYGL